MKTLHRVSACLLFVLLLVLSVDLVRTWRGEPGGVVSPEHRASAASASETDRNGSNLLERLSMIEGMGVLSCAFLLCLQLAKWRMAKRDAAAKEEAERALERERRALEARVEERTRELRQEVEERRRAEEINRGQKVVLEALATRPDATTGEILSHLTESLAAQRRSWACSIHLADPNGLSLELAACSEIGEKLHRHLLRIDAGFPDAPESVAFSTGQPFILEKLAGQRRPWGELLVANGIHSVWSVPFFATEPVRVAGTVTVYSRLQYTPSARDLDQAQTAASLTRVVIEHRRIHTELVHNAYQDALTGLPNRRAGERAIERAIEQARERDAAVAVLWVDLNRFKRVNDQYGHAAGDEVLRTVARRLEGHSLAEDVARMGGDEFLVLAPSWKAVAEAPTIAERLGEAIAKPISIGPVQISVTASIGICNYPGDGLAIDTLERNADLAMYRAKANGIRTCLYSPALAEETSSALEIELALCSALENDLFHLAYQPIYSKHGSLSGFEALLRSTHPKLSKLSPALYVPIAEQTQLIVPIGNKVLREACRQLREWCQAGHAPVTIAVNISALQFSRENFADSVAALLSEYELPPELLHLELTESVVMENHRAVVTQMDLLRALGVRISMDDFGTGYSSLSHLHRLPIDVLKIDRSFIERIGELNGTRPIVEAVIAMSRHLGLQVVAEGVETAEQKRVLLQAGCDGLQGYLYSRPVPPHEAERILMGERETASGVR